MDTITLTIPSADHGLRPVATLVLGGVGSRFDLPFERVDDLELATLSMLDHARTGDVSIEMQADDGHVAVSVGPLVDGSGSNDGLRRVLSKLADAVEAGRRGEDEWLTVRLARASQSPSSG